MANGKVEYFSPSTYGLAAADGSKAVDLAWYTDTLSTGNLSQTFAFLDAVSVTAVPEASGVTMAFAALALLGGVAAKRRRS
jgi:MYXO-CTERM domain-containing protein